MADLTYDEAKDLDIEYLATDGVWYKLRDAYPIWISSPDHPTWIHMDNAGDLQHAQFHMIILRDDGYLWEVMPAFDGETWGDDIRRTVQWRRAA